MLDTFFNVISAIADIVNGRLQIVLPRDIV